jgi:hypothetical protein
MNYHINNVHFNSDVMYVGGTKLDRLLAIQETILTDYAILPYTTHNARPFKDGVLYNDTARDRVVTADKNGTVTEIHEIPIYDESQLKWTHLTADRARQGFGRGLCVSADGYIIAGSSPSTISIYQSGRKTPVRSVQLSVDIRNSIHGLELWPFD